MQAPLWVAAIEPATAMQSNKLFLGLTLLAAALPSYAQQYPNKPVRVITPWPTGGLTDVVGRLIFQKISETTGQQFVVDNRPGAAGRTRAVSRVPACGM